MDNQKDIELFELNKDLNGSQNQSTEFFDLENQLIKYQNAKTPTYLKNTIMVKARIHASISQSILPLAAALFLIIFGGLIIYLNQKPKMRTITTYHKSESSNTNVANILEKEFGSNAPKAQKYYALYFTSAYCKSGIEFLKELDRFYIDQKAINPDFEIIFIELNNNVYSFNNQTALHFKKVDFDELQNKEFFKQFKIGSGPSLVVLDNKGNVLAKQKKNKHQNTFNIVLTEFSNLLAKS